MAVQTNRVLDAVMKTGRVGSWTFVEQLGSGGFGLVMKARRSHIDGTRQEAAIKLLAHDRALTPEAMLLFNHEFNVLKRLDSPYIAAVLDSGMDEVNLGRGQTARVQWIATEHVKGDDLRKEIRTHGPLDKAQWLEFAHDLLSAVEVAHSAAVIHRDIKPENIMRLSRKSVLIDFGGASFEAEADPGDSYVTYTPGFAAPEQLDGSNPEKLTAAADMFAVGCLLYFAATGTSPWGEDWRRTQDSAAAWYRKITREEPDLEPLDEQQRNLISEMLVISQSERISSSDALAEIEEFLPDSSSRSSHFKGHSSLSNPQEGLVSKAIEAELEVEEEESEGRIEVASQPSPPSKTKSAQRVPPRKARKVDEYSPKSFSTALALATWFGLFGVDRLYLGKTGSGVAKLLTGGGFLLWWVSDVNALLRGEVSDGKGRALLVRADELVDARRDMKRNSWLLAALILFLTIVGISTGTSGRDTGASPAPNVIGMNLNEALPLLGDFKVDEVDALGGDRSVFVESNWKVCAQSSKSESNSTSGTLTLEVVKTEETCP